MVKIILKLKCKYIHLEKQTLSSLWWENCFNNICWDTIYRRLRPTVTFHIRVFWTTSRRRFSPLNLPSITDVTSNSTPVSLCTVAGEVVTNNPLTKYCKKKKKKAR
jgi:hypothetical protein